MFLASFELGTFCVCGKSVDHYTIETYSWCFTLASKLKVCAKVQMITRDAESSTDHRNHLQAHLFCQVLKGGPFVCEMNYYTTYS